MAVRDPETGQFVSSSRISDAMEVVQFQKIVNIPASTLGGAADGSLPGGGALEDWQIYDLDEVLDRHEVGHLVHAQARLAAGITSTATADGTLRVTAEIGTNGAYEVVQGHAAPANMDSLAAEAETGTDLNDAKSRSAHEDTIELVHRALDAYAYGPITDGATGVGGAGSGGHDRIDYHLPFDYEVDQRDEMRLNAITEISNVSDTSVTWGVTGQHVYRVEDVSR